MSQLHVESAKSWVSKHVGPVNTQKGFSYHQERRAVVQLMTFQESGQPGVISYLVKGICHGTSEIPYVLWAILTDNSISQAQCTCPVGRQGKCKHIAALLLECKLNPQCLPCSHSDLGTIGEHGTQMESSVDSSGQSWTEENEIDQTKNGLPLDVTACPSPSWSAKEDDKDHILLENQLSHHPGTELKPGFSLRLKRLSRSLSSDHGYTNSKCSNTRQKPVIVASLNSYHKSQRLSREEMNNGLLFKSCLDNGSKTCFNSSSWPWNSNLRQQSIGQLCEKSKIIQNEIIPPPLPISIGSESAKASYHRRPTSEAGAVNIDSVGFELETSTAVQIYPYSNMGTIDDKSTSESGPNGQFLAPPLNQAHPSVSLKLPVNCQQFLNHLKCPKKPHKVPGRSREFKNIMSPTIRQCKRLSSSHHQLQQREGSEAHPLRGSDRHWDIDEEDNGDDQYDSTSAIQSQSVSRCLFFDQQMPMNA